jgi:hypothetical protein
MIGPCGFLRASVTNLVPGDEGEGARNDVATIIAGTMSWVFGHGTANAFDGTGAELQRACNQEKGTHDYYVCIAYVTGVYEGMWAAQRLFVIGRKTCLPGLTDEEVVAVVKKYINARPDLLKDPMAANVSAALHAEYRCK